MKGILFTVSTAFVGLTILSLLALLSHSSLTEQGSATRIVVFNRMQDEVEYISRELSGIMKAFNVTAFADKNTASITEDIPFSTAGKFQTRLDSWKKFTESNSGFNLSLDLANLKNNLLFLINNRVEYTHTNGVSGNKITVEQASSVANYSVYILAKSGGTISFDWDDIKAGQQNFTITVRTNNNVKTDSKKLDFSKGTDLTVKVNPPSGGDKEIDITIGKGADHGFLKVDDKDQLPITLTVNITINTTAAISIGLADNINIRSDLYNISRATPAKIA